MGCCSSTARINNPERATEAILATRDIFALQGILEEDEKTQDKLFTPSLKIKKESSDSTKPASKTPPETDKNDDKDIEISSGRTGSSPELRLQDNRGVIFHTKEDHPEENEDEYGKESYRNRLQLDESHVRISKEQHREIMQFVEERQCSLRIAITQLFQNLANNTKEHEKLSLLMEELKNNAKDIENCFEDLMSHPFPNDKQYFENLQVQSQAYKDVAFEYHTYCKNLRSYKEFRENILIFLVNYDQTLPDAVVPPTSSFMGRETENPIKIGRQQSDISTIFMPKRGGHRDDSRNEASYLDLDFDLRLPNQEFNHGGASIANRVIEKLPKQSPIQSSTSDRVIYHPENALAVYYSIQDELEGLNEGLKNLNDGYRIVQTSIQDYKAAENKGHYTEYSSSNHWQDIRHAERTLANNSEELRREFKKLQRRTNKLRSNANTNPSEVEGFVYSDYTEKLNEMEFELQNRLKEIDKLTAVFSLIFKDFFHQANERFAARTVISQPGYVTYIYNPQPRAEKISRREVYETCSPNDIRIGVREKSIGNMPVSQRAIPRDLTKRSEQESPKENYPLGMRMSGPKMQHNEILGAYPNTLKGDLQEVTTTEFALDDLSVGGSNKIDRKFKARADTTLNGDGYSVTRDHTQKTRNILSQTEISHEACTCG